VSEVAGPIARIGYEHLFASEVRVRVLGVDPGLTRCGLGVVEGSLGRPLVMCHVEVVTTPSGDALPDRLLVIASRVRDLIDQTSPDVVAVERMFSQHNLHTVMGTAQASAAAVLAAAEAGLPIAWHTPSEVKAAVTGTGRAEKAQVAGMVVRILRLDSTPTPVDATDALALAICHVWRGSASARIEAAAAPPARIPRRTAGSVRALPAAPAAAGDVARSTPGSAGATGRPTIGVRSGVAR
jgi:crossover junction endodeoxyribonuclease RuvC